VDLARIGAAKDEGDLRGELLEPGGLVEIESGRKEHVRPLRLRAASDELEGDVLAKPFLDDDGERLPALAEKSVHELVTQGLLDAARRRKDMDPSRSLVDESRHRLGKRLERP